MRALLAVLLLISAGPAWGFSFIGASPVNTSSDNTAITSVTCDVPSGTADNDFMVAVAKNGASETFTPPAGWASFGSPITGDTAGGRHMFYWRVASGEPANYAWSWATSARGGCSIYTFRSDFNVSDPVDVTSNTAYITSDTTARVASMNTSAVNEAIILIGVVHSGSAQSCTAQPGSPTTFTEHNDSYDSNSRFMRCVSSAVWSSSGATGNMDITLSNTLTDKRAIGIALKPSAGGAINFYSQRLRLQVQP